MATKSILKDICLKDNDLVRKFADAFEKARHVKNEEVEYTREYRELKGDKIKEFFGEK